VRLGPVMESRLTFITGFEMFSDFLLGRLSSFPSYNLPPWWITA
jgi:hypothetical protein